MQNYLSPDGRGRRADSAQPTHLEIVERMDRLDDKLDVFMSEMRSGMSDLKNEVGDVKKDVAQTKDLVEAWGAIKTVGRFVKWSGTLFAGIVASWVVVKAAIVALVR